MRTGLWYLTLGLAVIFWGQQYAVAGCTDEKDLTGDVCRSSPGCDQPCDGSSFAGGIQTRQFQIKHRLPILSAETKTTPKQSSRINFGSLGLLGLLAFGSPLLFCT